MKKKILRNLFLTSAALLCLTIPSIPAMAATCEFRTGSDGKQYWYEDGVIQGTYNDPQGVLGDGTVRGREIYDPASDGWYWLDSCYGGAKAEGKEVWVPYIYQNEADFDEAAITWNAGQSDSGLEQYVEQCIREKTGKWIRYDENGKMLKGWITISGALAQCYPDQAGNTYYYDNKTGLMAKGWITLDGTLYHFDEVTGALDSGNSQSTSFTGTVDPSKYTSSDILENVLSLTEDFDPDGYTFLQFEQENEGRRELDIWCTGEDSAARAADTCVHESFHGYVGRHYDYNWDTGYWVFGFYIDPDTMIMMSEGPSFKTEEWSETLPQDFRTFRFDTYVSAGAVASANQDGAYGLINEFSAYCWGLNNQVKLYPYYDCIGDLEDWNSDFENAVMNGTQAFTEFRFYILGYLNYARENYPDIYQSFLDNQEFVNIYCIMERRFENLIKQAADLGVSSWTNASYTLYTEVSKSQYQAVEQELFSRATMSVLPHITFNPQYNPNEYGFTYGTPVVTTTSLSA